MSQEKIRIGDLVQHKSLGWRESPFLPNVGIVLELKEVAGDTMIKIAWGDEESWEYDDEITILNGGKHVIKKEA